MRYAFELADLLQQHSSEGKLYHEFLRVPAMSAGLYILPAGSIDPQNPHKEDEMYYIIKGKGRFQVADEDYEVQAGSTLYVPKLVVHRFHTIEEDLHILVFFAPQES